MIIKNNPTIIEFNKLYQKYPDTIQCPCETYSIAYEEFITFERHLHSICSSTFVDENSQWLIIDYPQTMLIHSTRKDDFRQIGSPFFQLLNSFCNLSSKTINAELTTFYSSRFITLNLITYEQFQTQMNQLINQFIKNTARSFINSLFFAENMTVANMLFSAFQSDSLYSSGSPVYDEYRFTDYQYIYDRIDQLYNSNETGIDCDCQSTPWCIQQAIVYDLDTITQLFSPPGIFVGCYLVESVLQSDLRCFFDIGCLQQLIDSLSLVNISTSDIILNSTASRYQEKSSLLEIVSNLMVEEWNNQTFYDNYFNICQPSVCTATYISRGNIIYIITTTIGLIGGLTKVYIFIAPIFVKIIVRVIIPFIRKKRDGRCASIIAASVGELSAHVSQQHYKGKGNLGVHNRFTHYPCPTQKAIKINCGSTGIISNMIPSLQHVYTVSFLLDKVEYIPRQNIYDKPEIKKKSAFDIDVEEKWRRLRPMDNREYHHPSYRTDIALEQPETDATFEYSKSAYYYMFNRVYEQWKEVTNDNNQEHLDIISYKNSMTKPRFICNLARFRAIMSILLQNEVYCLINIKDVMEPPYQVSNDFIEANLSMEILRQKMKSFNLVNAMVQRFQWKVLMACTKLNATRLVNIPSNSIGLELYFLASALLNNHTFLFEPEANKKMCCSMDELTLARAHQTARIVAQLSYVELTIELLTKFINKKNLNTFESVSYNSYCELVDFIQTTYPPVSSTIINIP
ncbi:unnamed protein product, partial [Adineta steineri]